jgi:uncharacterized membrane protein YhaH (DUF805 family)
MKIQESVEVCITKKYADFEGAATRSEFWWFILFIAVVDALLSLVGRPLVAIFGLGMLVPYFAAGARRLHDTGRSGLWWLIGLVPVIGTIVLIVFFTQRGKTPTTPI